MVHFKLKLDRTSTEHRRPSINVRSLLPSTKCVTKETISPSANSESFRAKMINTPTYFPILTTFNLVANCAFSRKMKKSTPLWCEDCRFVSFETGLEKPVLTLNDDPNGFKNTTNVYSIHLELRMASPCQISTGKWKYVNPCLDFIGVPDQRTAYVKRQARPRWTYVRRSSVTPDLVTRNMFPFDDVIIVLMTFYPAIILRMHINACDYGVFMFTFYDPVAQILWIHTGWCLSLDSLFL